MTQQNESPDTPGRFKGAGSPATGRRRPPPAETAASRRPRKFPVSVPGETSAPCRVGVTERQSAEGTHGGVGWGHDWDELAADDRRRLRRSGDIPPEVIKLAKCAGSEICAAGFVVLTGDRLPIGDRLKKKLDAVKDAAMLGAAPDGHWIGVLKEDKNGKPGFREVGNPGFQEEDKGGVIFSNMGTGGTSSRPA